MTEAIVPPPPRRGGKTPKLEDPHYRAQTIRFATTGLSRRGIANMLGESSGCLYDWLARGKAQPDVEPYGSWCREFLAAERAAELLCTELQSQTVAVIARKPPHMRTMAEIAWVDRLLATRYPREHGNASAGTGQARVVDPEPDGEAWWQQHGLQGDQLRALLKDPPEAVREAMVQEADAVYACLIAGGWKPPRLTKGK